MVTPDQLLEINDLSIEAHRLVNSQFPPILLFEDVVSAEDFEVMYRLQSMVNPRLKAEIGELSLLPLDQIPFGIDGCSYVIAPFTHRNPNGSRFSDGSYGVLYLADTMRTALKEVEHHQYEYWTRVPELRFETFVFRGLSVTARPTSLKDATALPMDDDIYKLNDYSVSRSQGAIIRASHSDGIQYHSVRNKGATCWGLFSPKGVSRAVQSSHFEMVWLDNKLTTRKLSEA